MNHRTVLVIIADTALFIATQLLFFWLAPMTVKSFAAAYIFYLVLALAQAVVFGAAYYRYGLPSGFAVIAAGLFVAASGMTAILLLSIFDSPVRIVVFVGTIAVVIYIAVIAVLVAIAERESSRFYVPDPPVEPFADNPQDSAFSDTVRTIEPECQQQSMRSSGDNRQQIASRRMPYKIERSS